MKKNDIWKRICAVLLTGVLAFPVFGVNAKAEEERYVGTDSYVLYYSGEKSDVQEYQYISLYKPYATKNLQGQIGTRTGIVFNLYDLKNEKNLPTYCMDVYTGTEDETDYRRLNLEDATYLAGGAGLMRSVVLNSFPFVDLDTLRAAVGIENISMNEAIMATQLAIWKTAHGDKFIVKDFWHNKDNKGYVGLNNLKDRITHYDELKEDLAESFPDDLNDSGYPIQNNLGVEAKVEAHIEAVYNYLLNLEPTEPKKGNTVVSNEAFTEWSVPEVTRNEDGTYNVTVNVTVDVQMSDGDTLTLSAVLGDGLYYESANLEDGQNEIQLTIDNVPLEVAYDEVKLAIDGEQTVEKDAYMFDAVNNRDHSQTMVGVYGGKLPVHAEIVAEAERVLHIYKTTKIPMGKNGDGTVAEQRYPLENITFDLYQVATLEEYLSGEFEPEEVINMSQFKGKYPACVLTTDENGSASVNLTKSGLVDGVYVVAEREKSAIDPETSKPFYLMIPTTNESGDGWIYEITVEPKNGVLPGPEIRKDVIEIEHEDKSGEEEQKASVNAGVPFTWIVRGDVPADIADAKSYVITDTLDERLTYAENMIVKVAEKTDAANTESENCVLTAAKDYTVEATKSDSGIWEIKVSLTDIGMDRVARLAGENPSDYEVRVYFDTVIDEDAQMGDDIPNKATLDYTNSVNFSFNHESDEPVVYTCGINLYKYAKGNEDEELAGAKFKLARVATQEEIDAGLSTSLVLGLISGRADVVYVDFYDNADWTVAADETTADGETAATSGRVNVVTTDTEGKAMLYGLEAGEYYLVEIQAPAGYNMLNYPIKVTLDKTSAIADNVIKVANSDGFQLPATGGMGTVLFTVVGAGIVSGAGVSLVFKKRREDEE